MQTLQEIFGTSSDDLAREHRLDPQTSGVYSTAEHSPAIESPQSAAHALLDARHSAIFWITVAALVGLVLVTGQVRFEAGAGGRLGRR